MEHFATVIVKPTLDCDLHCRHCYHPDCVRSDRILDLATYEKMVKLVRDHYVNSRYIWHGGEPLLAPMSFYKKALAIQRKYYGDTGCDNTIQTNGCKLSKRFIEFCRSNYINIGVSYEGEFDAGLRPGMDVKHVDSMVEYMAKNEHMFLVSASIHGGNVDKMDAMYEKFKGLGASLSFSPVINLGCAKDNPDLALDPDIYIKNSIDIFEKWLHDKDVEIPLLPFYAYIMTVMDGAPNISDCPHASCLGKWLCLYPNGDVYPCGKACPEEYCLGNVNEVDSIDDLFSSQGFRNILVGSIDRRKKCKGCEIYDYCNGGCSIDALAEGDIRSPDFLTCKIYKGVMSHIRDVVNDILETKPDMENYNGFVKYAVLGKLMNPRVYDATSFQ